MISVLFAALLSAVGSEAGPVEEVRQAEVAFARAFAQRDREAFFAMVAEDATFLSAATTARGKKEIVARWTHFFETPQAPFAWGPERVSVSADGRLGLSTGPVYDPEGNHAGDYISTWRKSDDGSWRIVFDSSGPGPAPLPEHLPPSEEGFVTADDGLKLYYRRTGRGPVTMIAPLDNVLQKPFRQFGDIATIITYDPRNRGRSERTKDESTWTIQQDVRDLESVRHQLKVERFVPVGYSYLGLMVVLYAIDHPERVTRIVQLGPPPLRPQPSEVKPEAAAAFQSAVEKIGALGADAHPRERCIAFWEVFRATFVANPANAAKFDLSFCDLENEWGENLLPHLARLFASIEALEIAPEQLTNVRVPVLTIHGTEDRNAPYTAGAEWAASLPDARLVTIEGAAHASWLDDPVTVFGSIRHFLRGEWPLGARP